MFEQLVSFTKKVSDLPDQPALDAASLKAQFDAAPDEVRQYLNLLIQALESTTSGDSGAKNIGATTISGLTGNDVQTLLESLRSMSYTKTESDGKYTQGAYKILPGNTVGSNNGSTVVSFPANFFTSTPRIIVTPVSYSGQHTRFFVNAPTASGFTIFHDTTDWSSHSFNWIAIGN